MKKNNLKTLCLWCTSLLLMGCPYESKVALTSYENAAKFDKNLIGEWTSFQDDGSRTDLIITKLNAKVLDVAYKVVDATKKTKETAKYRAFASLQNNTVLYNIESKDGVYRFAKIDWKSKNELSISFIENDFAYQKLESDSATITVFTTFIKENNANEKFYEAPIEFYKKDSPEYEKVKIYMKKSGF